MKCLILAAGYATRLYPLTEDFPKPLLDVNGKSILDWLISDLNQIGQIDDIIIVSNHKFIRYFNQWKETATYRKKITILDDGSVCNEDRLGAVKDIGYAIGALDIKDDLMVIAGDNLLDFSFIGFIEYFKKRNKTSIMRHYEGAIEKLRKTGVASINSDDKVVEMQEKPLEPKSNWAVPPFYIYRKEDLPYIIEGILSPNCDTDAPGSFISWLCTNRCVYAYKMPGKRYDIGDIKSYQYVKEIYNGFNIK